MDNLYNKIKELCDANGISPFGMCKKIGIQPSVMTDLKMGRQSGVSAKTADKIAKFFNVSVAYLLGTEDPGADDPDNILKFALWGNAAKDIPNEKLEEVKNFARYIKETYEKNKE